AALLPVRLNGISLNPGLAVAPAVLHEPRLAIRHVVAEDSEAELRRLAKAMAAMQTAIDGLVATSHRLGAGGHREIIEAYRMFAAARGWLGRIPEGVKSGLTAEAAVARVSDETRGRMAQVADPLLRERLFDLEDLANRLQQFLSGQAPNAETPDLPREFIL